MLENIYFSVFLFMQKKNVVNLQVQKSGFLFNIFIFKPLKKLQ